MSWRGLKVWGISLTGERGGLTRALAVDQMHQYENEAR